MLGNDETQNHLEDKNDKAPLIPPPSAPTQAAKKENEEMHGAGYWIGYYFGKFCALGYGILCGLGTASAINSLFDSPGMGFAGSEFVAYAFGSVTFVVNVAIFWFVVPSMLVKLLSPKHSMYDESFEATVNGQKRYIKIKKKNERSVTVERYSLRWWMITLFSFAFAAAAALSYTGLLMSKLADTTGWMGIGATGSGFLAVAIPFFIISVICNWAFNKYDASEQISRHDFFSKLWDGILKLLTLRVDHGLMLESEIGTPPSDATLRARQALRLAIFSGIAYLGFYAIYSVAHMGTAGLFGFMGLAIVPAAKWAIVSLSMVAGSYYYTNATFRFSSIAGQRLTKLFLAYRSIGSGERGPKFPAPFYWATQLTVAVPVLILLGAALSKFLTIEWNHLKNAYARKDELEPETAPWSDRAFYDMKSAWRAWTYEVHNESIDTVFWNYLVRPTVTLCVGLGQFISSNLIATRAWYMHALAFTNAAGNGAFSNPALQLDGPQENPLSPDALKATAGGFQGSMQCYVNSVTQGSQPPVNGYVVNQLRFTDTPPTQEETKASPDLQPLAFLDMDTREDLLRRRVTRAHSA